MLEQRVPWRFSDEHRTLLGSFAMCRGRRETLALPVRRTSGPAERTGLESGRAGRNAGSDPGVKRREVKSKGEKERYKHLNAEFQRIAPDMPGSPEGKIGLPRANPRGHSYILAWRTAWTI